MGTSSHIGILDNDKVISVYCLFDSKNNIEILSKSYNTRQKALELLSYGDMRSLGEDIKSCEFLCRDKGEDIEETSFITWDNEKHFLDATKIDDYTFLFKDDKWYYREWDNELKPIENAGTVETVKNIPEENPDKSVNTVEGKPTPEYFVDDIVRKMDKLINFYNRDRKLIRERIVGDRRADAFGTFSYYGLFIGEYSRLRAGLISLLEYSDDVFLSKLKEMIRSLVNELKEVLDKYDFLVNDLINDHNLEITLYTALSKGAQIDAIKTFLYFDIFDMASHYGMEVEARSYKDILVKTDCGNSCTECECCHHNNKE